MIDADDIRAHVQTADPAALAKAVVTMWESRTRRLWQRRELHVLEVEVEHEDDSFWVPLYPIETIVVKHAGVVVAGTEYSIAKGRGRVDAIGGWPGNSLEATVTGGYTKVTAPADARQAMIEQAKFMVSRNPSTIIHLSSQGLNNATTSFLRADMHPLFDAVAGRYERLV
jgi:hypothetical protein